MAKRSSLTLRRADFIIVRLWSFIDNVSPSAISEPSRSRETMLVVHKEYIYIAILEALFFSFLIYEIIFFLYNDTTEIHHFTAVKDVGHGPA